MAQQNNQAFAPNDSPNVATFGTAYAVNLAALRHHKHMQTRPRAFLSINDLTEAEMKALVADALSIKKNPGAYADVLKGQKVALLFQKTSTRTRCAFELGAVEMGAYATYIDWRTSNFTLAELSDESIVLSRFYDMIVARVNENDTLQVMQKHSESPVINGLCNKEHPSQIIADFATMSEYFGPNLNGLHIAYIGDGNNVCRSLSFGAAKMGCQLALCGPQGYRLDQGSLDQAGGAAFYVETPEEAVAQADIVYTDTWVSMGDEAAAEARLKAFLPYQVNEALMAKAPKHALFMHCLPAHPGLEVTGEVLRSPHSIAFDQAENRKYAHKAIMAKFAKK